MGKTESAVVVRKIPRLNKRLILTVIVGILFVGAVVVYCLAVFGGSDKGTKYTPQEISDKVNNLVEKKQYKAAIDLVNSQKDINTKDKQFLVASVYASQGSTSQALTTYDALAKGGTDETAYSAAVTAAGIAVDQKNTALAIQYYELAIKLAKGNSPTAESDIAAYQDQISSLKGGIQ